MSTSSSLAGDAAAANNANNPLTRKLAKILSGGDGLAHGAALSDDMLEVLQGLSVFFKDNTKRARAGLRGDLERRSLSLNTEFLAAFQEVQEVS